MGRGDKWRIIIGMRLFPAALSTFPSRPWWLLGLALAALHFATPAPGGAAEPPSRESAGSDPALPLYEIDLRFPGASARMAGLDLDFMQVRPGIRAKVLGWPGTRERLEGAGLVFRTVTENYGASLARERQPVPSRDRLGTESVPAFGSGSLAGFWTMDEVYALLDSLAASDTQGLLTGPDTIGVSLQGRPILALGLAGPSAPLGTRPEVLLTALTHAREPEGMQTILYFLLQLIDGYGVDPELTYLVDNREIWFVPVVNPDGYVRNENTWVDTGTYGMWRKNLRDNDGNGNINFWDGVDLNRNFGYQWGYDNGGSSGNPQSPTYRGTSGFSEPETQVLRDFCNAHSFRIANNYHSYWEISLYPWGYQNTGAPDSTAFVELGDALTLENRYGYGRGGQILYPVNGDSNDWMYGEQGSKPKIFAFTTEVGNQNDGFWPPASRIVPLAQLNLRANMILAYAASVYLDADEIRIESPSGVIRPGEYQLASLHLSHLGVADATVGGITVTAASGDPDLVVVDDHASFQDMNPGEKSWSQTGFLFYATNAAVPGTEVPLYLELSDGSGYVGRDTLSFRVGDPATVFFDDASSGLLQWTAGGFWGIETTEGETVFSDSPGQPYQPNYDAALTLNQALDLSGATHAVLRFRTQWDVELGWDFARVEASVDSGGTWTALAGENTRPGHGVTDGYAGGVQPLDEPGYDGNQRFWITEETDLSAYAGLEDVRIRFRMTSDGGDQRNGIFVDDVSVLGWAPGVPLEAAVPGTPPAYLSLTASPNPVRGATRIYYRLPVPSAVRVSIYDVSGRELRVLSQGLAQAGERSLVWDGRDARGRMVPAGAYFAHIKADQKSAAAKLLVVQ